MGTNVAFEIIANDRASRTFNNVGQAADRSSGKLKAFAKVGALAVAGAAVVAGKALFDMTKAAVADEAAQKKLALQLRNSAGATDEQVASVEDWITRTGALLGVADDELRPALARLVTATKDVGKAQDLAALAMDVSAGTGKSLKSVTEALMKAQNGSVSGLSRLGVATKNAKGETMSFDKVVGQMAATFNGQAVEAADTTEGKFNRLKVMFDETKEAIGARLIPVATRLADWFLREGVPALDRFGSWIDDKVIPALRDLGGWIGDNVVPVLRGFAGFVTDHVIPALQTFGERVLVGLRGFIDNVSEGIENNRPFLESLARGFQEIGKWIVDNVIPALGTLAEHYLPAVGKAIGTAITVVKKLSGWLLDLGIFGVDAFRFLLNAALETFDGILNAAEWGLGWIPGIGDKIADANRAFDNFRENTINALDKTSDALRRVRGQIDGIDPTKHVDVTIEAHYVGWRSGLTQGMTSGGGSQQPGSLSDLTGGRDPRAGRTTERSMVTSQRTTASRTDSLLEQILRTLEGMPVVRLENAGQGAYLQGVT